MSLRTKLLLRVFIALSLLVALLFIPAGTFRFWQGWALLALAFIPTSMTFLYFYKHDPQLMVRRLESKEKVGEQKWLVRLLRPVFFLVLLLPCLDYRFGWTRAHLRAVPLWLELLAQALFLGGYLLVVWTLNVNRFAARTIRVEPGQQVISAGPYGLVRHPMYSGSLLMLLSVPLILASYFGLFAFLLLVPFYVLRLLNEEKVLRQELPGYPEFCVRTRYHLIPFVW
jgi:protein-S-isoprenylcysteine O-methyltransferase Ste14